MAFAILCILVSSCFVIFLDKGDKENPNGYSVNILQKLLVIFDIWFREHPRVSLLLLASPKTLDNNSLSQKQFIIERLVWSCLITVSFLAICVEFVSIFSISSFSPECLSIILRYVVIAYIFLLQLTLFISLLRPLFGAETDEDKKSLNKEKSEKVSPHIPSPRRSLLMALINFSEIVISWGIIYRCLVPHIVTTMDQANYFSMVTFTTLGYGEINAGLSLMLQLAITLNMLVFLLFTICHVTTIMGAMSNEK